MKDWPTTGIWISRETKLQTTAKKSNCTGMVFLRCFFLFLCTMGTFFTVKEAFGLQAKSAAVLVPLGVYCLILGIVEVKGERWKSLLYGTNVVLCAAAVYQRKRLVSGYLAVENGVREQLGDYYKITLAQVKVPMEKERGEFFLFFVLLILLFAFGRLVIKKGRIALLALVQALIFVLELLCGCRFEGMGIYLVMCSILVLFAMSSRRGGRNQRILYRTGVWAAGLVLILMLVSGIFIGPLLFKNMSEFNEKLFDAIQEAGTKVSNAIQSQNGLFGNHTPTADGSLNNYGVDQDEETDLRITVSDKPQNSLYLRGFIGDTYEGTYWHRADRKDFEQAFSGEDAKYQVQNILYRYIEKKAGEEKSTAVVERVRPGGEYGYVPYGFETPDDANLQGDSYYSSAEDQMEYTGYVNWRKWLGNGAESEPESELEIEYRKYVADQYLKVPVHGLDRLKEYCAQWDFDTVQEVIDFVVPNVQEGRPYSMDLKPVPEGKDFAEYFFFDQKKGYCIHYATTAVLMFRLMGVPARYATGYVISPDAFSESEHGFTADIPDSQAHAWVEVYRYGKGWVPVEVTPGYGNSMGENGMGDIQTGEDEVLPPSETDQIETTPALPTATPEPVKDPETQTSDSQEPEKPGAEPDNTQNGDPLHVQGKKEQSLPAKILKMAVKVLFVLMIPLAVIALCTVSLWANRRRILKKRQRRFMQKNRNQGICEISYGLSRMLWDAGICESDTRDINYARRMEKKLEILEKGEYVAFIKLVQQAAYGPEMLTEEERLACLAFYHRIAAYLWQQMMKRKKFRWKYMKCYEIS